MLFLLAYKQQVKGFNFPNIVAKNTVLFFYWKRRLFPLLHRETGYWNRKDLQLAVWQYSNSDRPLCLNCSSIDTQWSIVLFVRSFYLCTVLCFYKCSVVFSKIFLLICKLNILDSHSHCVCSVICHWAWGILLSVMKSPSGDSHSCKYCVIVWIFINFVFLFYHPQKDQKDLLDIIGKAQVRNLFWWPAVDKRNYGGLMLSCKLICVLCFSIIYYYWMTTSKTTMNNHNSFALFQRTNHYLFSITNIPKLILRKI